MKPCDAATPPPTAETCEITGELTGKFTGVSHPDHPGPATKVTLTVMVLSLPGGQQLSTANVVKGKTSQTRSYRFTNVKAGVTYRVSPRFFESKPRFQEVQCRAGATHHENFTILRPLPEG